MSETCTRWTMLGRGMRACRQFFSMLPGLTKVETFLAWNHSKNLKAGCETSVDINWGNRMFDATRLFLFLHGGSPAGCRTRARNALRACPKPGWR